MKEITAIIRPEKLEALKDALMTINIDGMTLHQVLGCGNQHGWLAHHRGSKVMMNMLPKVEIRIVCKKEKVDEVVGLILKVAATGEAGDGKIFIKPIEDVIRIRTGERGPDAL
ncbi:MAG: P-II family nitrogen regulator [Eubacterium sp.]|nr:P-II family nitrogen regulator [Eubacterium sp.]